MLFTCGHEHRVCTPAPYDAYGTSVQAEQKASSSVASHGVYVFKFNAENLIKPYDQTVSQEMHAALTAKTTAMIGGISHPNLCIPLASVRNVFVHGFYLQQTFVRDVVCLPVLTCCNPAAHCPD